MMNIYVSNLAGTLRDEELKTLFEGYGMVSSAKVMVDKFSLQSKGFGFVEMPDRTEAEKAIDALNGKMVDGRAIAATEARPREERNNIRPALSRR